MSSLTVKVDEGVVYLNPPQEFDPCAAGAERVASGLARGTECTSLTRGEENDS